MSYVPLWQLAEELGCESAYALLVEPRFRQVNLGSRFRYDGQYVYINRDVEDPRNIVFDVFLGVGNYDTRLTYNLANRLSVDLETYERITGYTMEPKVEATIETEKDNTNSVDKTTKLIVLLTFTAAVALVANKSGVLDRWFNKSNTKK